MVPKRSADAMKNASEIERYTGTPGTFSANEAVRIARPRVRSIRTGSAPPPRRYTECPMAARPAPMTTLMKTVSAETRRSDGGAACTSANQCGSFEAKGRPAAAVTTPSALPQAADLR